MHWLFLFLGSFLIFKVLAYLFTIYNFEQVHKDNSLLHSDSQPPTSTQQTGDPQSSQVLLKHKYELLQLGSFYRSCMLTGSKPLSSKLEALDYLCVELEWMISKSRVQAGPRRISDLPLKSMISLFQQSYDIIFTATNNNLDQINTNNDKGGQVNISEGDMRNYKRNQVNDKGNMNRMILANILLEQLTPVFVWYIEELARVKCKVSPRDLLEQIEENSKILTRQSASAKELLLANINLEKLLNQYENLVPHFSEFVSKLSESILKLQNHASVSPQRNLPSRPRKPIRSPSRTRLRTISIANRLYSKHLVPTTQESLVTEPATPYTPQMFLEWAFTLDNASRTQSTQFLADEFGGLKQYYHYLKLRRETEEKRQAAKLSIQRLSDGYFTLQLQASGFTGMSPESLVTTIQEKQAIIFNQSSPKKELDKANIQIERLMAEYALYLELTNTDDGKL